MAKDSDPNGGQIRLACEGLWKVFGPNPQRLFENADTKSEKFSETLLDSGFIPAVRDVSFSVREGEIFVIMGLSGSGKSTVVRCLSRLIEATAGTVTVDGQDLQKISKAELIQLRRTKLGMVFQNFGLLPHLNVLDNVAYPLRVQGINRREREVRAGEMIDLVGLTGRELSFPHELSGGMQQRVGIARSLAVGPDIWFLDEPFSALDPLIRRQMQNEFLRIQAMLNKTIVFITHDFLEALRLADRVAVMRDGRIVQVAPPAELVLNPVDDYVAEFTADVPRASIVTAGAISRPVDQQLDLSRAVRADTPLARIVPKFVGKHEPVPVIDDSNSIVAQVTIDDVLAKLVSGQDE